MVKKATEASSLFEEETLSVPNTAETYQTMLGHREANDAPGSLASFLGEEESPSTEQKAWEQYWKGMPAFTANDVFAVKQLNVCFKSWRDYEKFSELLGPEFPLTEKTKTVWWPNNAKDNLDNFRWADDGKSE